MSSKTKEPTTLEAMFNGLKCRCPNCGEAKLFARYLEPVRQCPVCGETFGAYQVGLLLPFIVITLLGHILVFGLLELARYDVTPIVSLAILIPLTLVVSLLVMPPIKGALIGILWSRDLSDEQR